MYPTELLYSEKDTLALISESPVNSGHNSANTKLVSSGKTVFCYKWNFIISVKSFSYLLRKCAVTCYLRVYQAFKLSFQFRNCPTQKHFYKHFLRKIKCVLLLFLPASCFQRFLLFPLFPAIGITQLPQLHSPVTFWSDSGCIILLGVLTKRALALVLEKKDNCSYKSFSSLF